MKKAAASVEDRCGFYGLLRLGSALGLEYAGELPYTIRIEDRT